MIFKRLRDAGVLGINARNAELIARWNERRFYPRVDNKLLARRLAEAKGVRVARLIATVEAYGELRQLGARLEGERDFVIKPVHGAMGNGVLVITDRDRDSFLRSDGVRLSLSDLEYHLAGILAGLYSLGGRVDAAMVEERLVTHEVFSKLAVRGVPDVRVIVFRGVPVMAMTRLPTHESRGRANLHQGAVAAGIDLATGRTTCGIHHNRPVSRHPETGEALAGMSIPLWDELLELSARCAEAFELGYIGVDLVLDARHGPVLLEANARPGLSIQLANGAGLWPRLRRVAELNLDGVDARQRAALARQS